jgi:hypothetical protein
MYSNSIEAGIANAHILVMAVDANTVESNLSLNHSHWPPKLSAELFPSIRFRSVITPGAIDYIETRRRNVWRLHGCPHKSASRN